MAQDDRQSGASVILPEIKWISADETKKFDEFFELPFVHYQDTVSELRQFYIWRKNLFGGTQISIVYSKLDEVLTVLADRGEEPSKLLDWITSTKDTDFSNDDSRHQWHKYFELISNKVVENSVDLVVPKVKRIALNYMKYVDSTYSKFHKLSVVSEREWLESSENRSNFDNVLWETHYNQFGTSPVGMERVSYKARLQRNWWNVERVGVTDEEKAEMYNGLVTMGANNANWRWQDTHPIDEVFGAFR